MAFEVSGVIIAFSCFPESVPGIASGLMFFLRLKFTVIAVNDGTVIGYMIHFFDAVLLICFAYTYIGLAANFFPCVCVRIKETETLRPKPNRTKNTSTQNDVKN